MGCASREGYYIPRNECFETTEKIGNSIPTPPKDYYGRKIDYLLMRKLKPHQKQALNFLRSHNGQAGLFMACGTMKTSVAIRYAQQYLPILVICRRDDFLTWKQELSLEGIPKNIICFIKSGKQELLPNPNWIIVTYDLIRNKRIATYIKTQPWKIVIADESHSIKRWKAQRTKKVIRTTRHIPRRIAMTGTPKTNKMEDFFTQCLFIDNGKLFGQSYWEFRNTYYMQSGLGWYLKHNSKKRIIAKLQQLVFYVDEDDVLTLPPKRHLTKAVPMSGQQRRYYKRIVEDWGIELSGQEIIELNQVVAQLTKLRQVASGFIYDKNHRPVWLKSTKLKLLKELLTSEDYLVSKKKVVIWCSHTAEIHKIAELATELNIKFVIFTGSNRKKKDKARKKFCRCKSIKLFIGQADSGVGMNELVVADTAVYYSNSFKVVSRQQSEPRIRRPGSERHKIITYWDLISENSIDEHILKSLQQNISVADYILSKIREGQQISQVLK